MAQQRKFEGALRALRGAGMALVTAVGLTATSAKPAWLPIVVGATVGALSFVSSELAIAIAVVALSVPVIAAQPVLGFMMLIALTASVHYLGAHGGRIFLIIGLSLVGAFLGPVWAGVALAGYLLGTGEGALTAAVACLAIEVCGLALGRPFIGTTVTGGVPAHAIVNFAHMPDTLLSTKWIVRAFASLDGKSVTRTLDGFTQISQPLMLFLQPWIWGLGAVASGSVGAGGRGAKGALKSLAAVGAGVGVAAAGCAAAALVLKITLPSGWVGMSLLASLVAAGAFVILWEQLFSPKPAPKVDRRRVSMAAEDADVDELLRLIASAEDKLTTQHTSVRAVMITDMKSFSRMTEEDGSVATAKAIQRHRDLLLPIVQSHRGAGKSTGGDGLVAAFESPQDALLAAVEMQQALTGNNAAHPDQRQIWVRIGVASGEVVLDNGGRPFIGAGLNLAARVMNLADGGQIFTTAEVAAAGSKAAMRMSSFGAFELKNIARPVEIAEVLWAPDQQPRDPRETGAAVPEEAEE